MYQFLWIFFVYSFLGWCTEVSYVALVSGRFVNRGFLNGPVCPIYGFGVVIVLGCLEPLQENLLLLFLGSVVLTSLLEWLTGFLLEKLFHQRWWDYSDQPFNLGGYICLRFSIMWGLACLFVVKIVHPSVLLLIRLIPRPLGWTLLAIFGVVLAVDLAATLRTIAKINRSLGQIDELAAKIRGRPPNDLGRKSGRPGGWTPREKGADLKEALEGGTAHGLPGGAGRPAGGPVPEPEGRTRSGGSAAARAAPRGSWRSCASGLRSCWTQTGSASAACSPPSPKCAPLTTRTPWSGCAAAWSRTGQSYFFQVPPPKTGLQFLS